MALALARTPVRMAASQNKRCNALRCSVRAHASDLAGKKCVPCEEAKDALEYTGLSMTIDQAEAEQLLASVEGWQLRPDAKQRPRIRKRMRTKNFAKALELFQRIGEVAEAEGHHPDLHLVGYNTVAVELWTHARSGLSENDFIMAAKIDALPLGDLLSKKPPPPEEEE